MGLVNTLWMSVACMTTEIVIGVLCAVARGSPNPVLRVVAVGYAWFFRGTPVILQLLIWFNLGLVFPYLGIPGLFTVRTVNVITPAIATLLGLGINQGAYASEVMRSGMLSVDHGQYEAAKAIGMGQLRSLRRIILPQAMRVVIPPLGNEFIALIKTTSLASIIQFPRSAAQRGGHLLRQLASVIELLMVAGLLVSLVVSILTPLDRPCWSAASAAALQAAQGVTVPSYQRCQSRQATSAISRPSRRYLDVQAGRSLCIIGPPAPARRRSFAASTSLTDPFDGAALARRRTSGCRARRHGFTA